MRLCPLRDAPGFPPDLLPTISCLALCLCSLASLFVDFRLPVLVQRSMLLFERSLQVLVLVLLLSACLVAVVRSVQVLGPSAVLVVVRILVARQGCLFMCTSSWSCRKCGVS